MTGAFTSNDQGPAYPYQPLYIIGPTAEVRLPFHLSIEVDVLYRRNGFNYSTSTPISDPPFSESLSYRTVINDLQFPILAKYEFKGIPLLRPFVSGGLVYRHTGVSTNDSFATFSNTNSAGIAIGGGVALKVGPLRLSPQIRYTYWPSPSPTSSLNGVSSTSNQADFLVAFTF